MIADGGEGATAGMIADGGEEDVSGTAVGTVLSAGIIGRARLVKQFTYNPLNGLHTHWNPAFREFRYTTKKFAMRPTTPPILMTEAVYAGLKRERPAERSLVKGWLKTTDLKIPGYPGIIYGCDVIYTDVKDP
jgi:hypothetical protein